MRAPGSIRRRLARALWSAASWCAGRRRATWARADFERHWFRSQTRGMGLGLSEWARNRLRIRWLRLRRSADLDPR
jgi:hypothetical protein